MSDIQKPEYLYVVFSATPYTIGKIIRKVTGNRYNHVSISFDKSLESLYSFARYYENTPLYGGFVEESLLRYQCKKSDSRVFVCAIPMTSSQSALAVKRLYDIKGHSQEYIYNLFSAACFPFGRSVKIDNSYTCIEFVCSFLESVGLYHRDSTEPLSVDGFMNSLKQYKIYEGCSVKYHIAHTWGCDHFPEHQTRRLYFKETTKNINRLIKRYKAERSGA